MTREEREKVITILENYKDYEDSRTEDLLHHGYDNTKESRKRKEALDEAIKALSVPEREKGEYIKKEDILIELKQKENFYREEIIKYKGVFATTCKVVANVYKHLILFVSDLPVYAVPEREKGEWIEKEGYDGDTYYDCSACGNSWTTIEGTPWDNGMDFCPNCGAYMERLIKLPRGARV